MRGVELPTTTKTNRKKESSSARDLCYRRQNIFYTWNTDWKNVDCANLKNTSSVIKVMNWQMIGEEICFLNNIQLSNPKTIEKLADPFHCGKEVSDCIC